MYAFTQPLRDAWSQLLAPLPHLLSAEDPGLVLDATIAFTTDDHDYQDPGMLIGHTCGYPYMVKWQPTHRLVCVPEFDIPGCEGKFYSSWFITNANSRSANHRLEDCIGKPVAINGNNSNSGMNVLRYGLLEYFEGNDLFSEVIVTGTHLKSMEAVASGTAALAAIDAVSYHHSIAIQPELAIDTRVIGQSLKTASLPFIIHRSANTSAASLTDKLNHCLEQLPDTARNLLRINRFTVVTQQDYQNILDIEIAAQNKGYGSFR